MSSYVVIHPTKKLGHKTKKRHKVVNGLTFTPSWKKARAIAKKYGTEFRSLLDVKYQDENKKIVDSLIRKHLGA